MDDFNEKYRQRTKKLALEIIKLYRKLPNSDEARILGKQLIRSGTSVAANFRASCRARSGREYYAKFCIVVEECDETLFWLELIEESDIFKSELSGALIKESGELLAVFARTKMKLKQ